MNLEAVSVKGAILTGALLESLIGAIRNMNWTQFDGRADAGARPASTAEDGSQKPPCDPQLTQVTMLGRAHAVASAAPEA